MILRSIARAAVLLFQLAPSIANAASFLPPPNIILPNYDRTLVGKIPSLEAGAYSARVDDASSNWYNPAGLTQAPKTAINASTSAYRWTGVKASAGGEVTGSTTGGQPPSFLGVVLAPPLLGSDRLRVGFSVTNETYWAPALQQEITGTTGVGQTRRILYSTRDNFSETIPALAVAYSTSDQFHFGLSVAGDIVNYQANDTISNKLTDASSLTVAGSTSQITASGMNLLFGAGAQYEISEHWKVSGAIKSPGLRVFGSGKITLENQTSSAGTTTDVAFFDQNTVFRYTHPFQASLGVAYLSTAFELEADLRFSASVGPYTTFSSTAPITTTTSTGAAPTTTTAPFNDVTTQFRNITNLALGSMYKLSDSVNIHLGYYRSNSPLAEGDSPIFRKVDLNGITAGASVKVGQFSGSLGAAYEFGTSDPYTVPNLTIGQPVTTTVDITTLSVLYALSVSL